MHEDLLKKLSEVLYKENIDDWLEYWIKIYEQPINSKVYDAGFIPCGIINREKKTYLVY